MSLFLRLLEDDDKAAALREALDAVATGRPDPRVFEADPEAFREVPGAPFAYWVNDAVRASFRRLPALEAQGRTARRGPSTCDDVRYLRCFWEVDEQLTHALGVWHSFAKDGAFSPYYADIHLLVDWEPRRQTFLGFFGRPGREIEKPESVDHFFRPGLTWPRRTNGLSFRAMPAGCIFADKGPAAFIDGDDPDSLLTLCAVVNSAPFGALVALQLARTELAQSYEVGLIQQTPVPPLTTELRTPNPEPRTLSTLAHRAWSLKRTLDTATETSHAFLLPALLQTAGTGLTARTAAWADRVKATETELVGIQAEIDDRCFALYGIDGEDRRRIEAGFGNATEDCSADDRGPTTDDDEDQTATADPAPLTTLLLSWALGVAFGRFDPRLATGQRAAPAAPDPFDPLPVCSPAQLQNAQGLPVGPDDLPAAYPVEIPWDGILVDDPGHGRDLTARGRHVLEIVFGDGADAAWREAAEILDARETDLRDWFARSFFADHLKRYSKSRRKAPIYWQLATPSASYSVWLYLHHFTRDTLYKVLNDSVTPKLQHEERKLTGLVQGAAGTPTANQRKEIAEQEGFVEELRAFRDEVARVAPLWNPDLNDGVIINFAPLWRLVPQHRSWQKECKDCWDKLAASDYDWSHLAMHLWPERVVPKCAADRSLAIAHGLEAVFWKEGEDGKWRVRRSEFGVGSSELGVQGSVLGVRSSGFAIQEVIADLVRERTSAAVKDALNSLLAAPAPVSGRAAGRRGTGRAQTRERNPGAGARVQQPEPRTPNSELRTPNPTPETLDAVKQAIAAAAGGTSKSEVLAATGLTDAQWNIAINALLAAGTVIKTGAARGTRYHLAAAD
jgi:hypothetical protein